MRIAVLGAGGWGIALSRHLHMKGHGVRLWDISDGYVEVLRAERENRRGLPGVRIPEEVEIEADIGCALEGADVVVFVSVSKVTRRVAKMASECDFKAHLMVSCTKGIEDISLRRMSEVISEEIGSRAKEIVVLSGPSHAEEVGRGIPTSVVVASSDPFASVKVQDIFMSPTFRVYTSSDVIGVELGGALKNVIAIASGICDGLGLGDNAKGALLTRGLAEITRLGKAMGADPLTFSGLSGMGDLITTCISRHSRNRYVGEEIGRGRKLKDILSGMVNVAEGIDTTKSALKLSKKYGVEMPITEQVHAVLFEDKSPERAVSELMLRDAKPEIWW